ncbi:MAG: hypothetical protein ACI841_000736 [Planctomycetota bacterium]|jgi:hypothetical protein
MTELVHGSGVAGLETRSVNDFNDVTLHGGVIVNVEVGAGPHLSLCGDANLLPYIEIEQNASQLTIQVRDGFQLHPEPVVTLMAPALTTLSVVGSGQASVRAVSANRLELMVMGSGSITAVGNAEVLQATVAGSGEMRLAQLNCQVGEVTVTGSGTIMVQSSETLDATVLGSGIIRYRGDATVKINAIGSGRILSSN